MRQINEDCLSGWQRLVPCDDAMRTEMMMNERVRFDGTHFRLRELDNGFRHHSVFTVGA